jgi:LuxR family maltose regulon positive regulatory protein
VFDTMLKNAEDLVAGLDISHPGPSLLTTAELKVLQYLPSHLSFPEIGQQLWLSRHTVKSQAMSAYRKLGVSSRSEAVTRARQLGLLPPR